MKGIVPVDINLELLSIPDRTIPYRGRLSQQLIRFDTSFIARVDFRLDLSLFKTIIMKKRLWIGGIVILAAVIYLLYLSFGDSVSYYVKVSEFFERIDELADTNVRVAGNVADAPVEWNAEDIELLFTLTEGGRNMTVIYNGAQPAGFKAGSTILAEGKYGSDDIFRASQIIMKCPSKYESIDIE